MIEKKIAQNTLVCHILLLCLTSCINLKESLSEIILTEPHSKSKSSSEVVPYFNNINLNGTIFSVEEHGPFEIWECRRFLGSNKVLFEVGLFKNPKMANVGFILYDRTSYGDLTLYQRRGINKRWDWETDSGRFSFVMKPDGIGHFFDFSGVPEGEKIESQEAFSCNQKTNNSE